MRWSKVEKEFIEPQRVARLATVDRKGVPHNVPICPLLDGGKIYIGTEARAKKVGNILSNPNVAVVFDDYTEAWKHLRGIMVQGRARVLPGPEFRRIRRKMYARYLLYKTYAPLTEADCAIIEITPAKKFSWGL